MPAMAGLVRETTSPTEAGRHRHCGCQDRLAAYSRRNPESCLRYRQLHLPMPSAVPGVVGHTPTTCPQAGSASFSVDLRRFVPWFRVAHRPGEGLRAFKGGFSDRTASGRTFATEVRSCAAPGQRADHDDTDSVRRMHTRFTAPGVPRGTSGVGRLSSERGCAGQVGRTRLRWGRLPPGTRLRPGHPPCPVQPQICAGSIARPPASQPIAGSARRPAPVSQHLRRPTVTASARLAH
jgi:hypothetical protein